jgi:Fe-S-cluster containining protein
MRRHIFTLADMIKDSVFNAIAIEGKGAKGNAFSFPCLRCGVCCSKYQALLSGTEVWEIADGLHISPDEFVDRYTDHRWGGTESFLLRHQAGACVFLSRTGNSLITGCIIDPFKPSDCRAWAADPGRPECQEGLRIQGAPR